MVTCALLIIIAVVVVVVSGLLIVMWFADIKCALLMIVTLLHVESIRE
jgi:hypothetical protein